MKLIKVVGDTLYFEMNGEHVCTRCKRKGVGKFTTIQRKGDPESARDLCLQCADGKVKR